MGFLLICGVLSLSTEKFFTARNLTNVAQQVSQNAIIAVGMTFVILTAGIDLSVGSVLALVGVFTAATLTSSPLHATWGPGAIVAGAVGVGLLTGAGAGVVNGTAVALFRVPPFIATLSLMTIARGLARLYTNGVPIGLPSADDPFYESKAQILETFSLLGHGRWLNVPVPVWVTFTTVLVAYLVLAQTHFGRYVYAVGGNLEAARLSGVPVRRVVFAVYIIAGVLTGISGIIEMAMLQSGGPEAGFLYELNAIAAVVVGGTSLMGGRGGVWGTLVGALIIGVMNNGLNLLEISPFWQDIAKGLVILVAVLFDQMTKRER